ncbi:MAG: exo-alpha-sialidase [Candidatus Aminicenantes bacterium]|nr:MAG: exo-alpha-sialidase [Candidatus Aminicenantes bacterium]
MKQSFMTMTACLVIFILFVFNGCKGIGGDDEESNPIPVLSSLSPVSKVSHMPSFPLTAYGANFVTGAKIFFNGVEKETGFVSAEELSCQIDPGDIASSESAAVMGLKSRMSEVEGRDVPVVVLNPSPGGGYSNIVNFTIYNNHTFTDPLAIPGGDGRCGGLSFAVDEAGNLNVVYEFFPGGVEAGEIRFIRSPDNGDTWETPVTVAQDSGDDLRPCMAVDGEGGINTVFNANNRVCFTRSIDQGRTWSGLIYVSDEASQALVPLIAVDGEGGMNVVWAHTYDNWYFFINFIRSTDSGVNWSESVNIFKGWENFSSAYNVSMAVDMEGGVYAAWTAWPSGGSRYSHVYFNYSHDYGVTWGDSDQRFGVCNASDIAVDTEGTLDMVLSSAYIPFMYQIVFKKSTNRGASWDYYSEVTSGGNGSSPRIRIDRAGNINVIYASGEFNFTRSTDSGASWSEAFVIAESVYAIDFALDHYGNIYVVFVDNHPGQLYITRSTQ